MTAATTFFLCIVTLLVFAQQGAAAEVNVNLPGSNPASAGPAGIIGNFYESALLISGLLAFAVIVYAGLKYALAVGNPSKQSDARDHVTQAFLGLLLLLGAFVILNTINPGLTEFQLAGLEKLAPPQEQNTVPVCGGTTFGTCSVGACVLNPTNPGQYMCSVNSLGSNKGCYTLGSTIACCTRPDCSNVQNPGCRPGTISSYTECQRIQG